MGIMFSDEQKKKNETRMAQQKIKLRKKKAILHHKRTGEIYSDLKQTDKGQATNAI